jgi:hypothetical protein
VFVACRQKFEITPQLHRCTFLNRHLPAKEVIAVAIFPQPTGVPISFFRFQALKDDLPPVRVKVVFV